MAIGQRQYVGSGEVVDAFAHVEQEQSANPVLFVKNIFIIHRCFQIGGTLAAAAAPQRKVVVSIVVLLENKFSLFVATGGIIG